MTNKQTKKAKRPLNTTLGKAATQNEKEELDLSHVMKPIETSVYGLRQVLSLLQTATEEVKNYITYECDILYECRVCRTIFRSLANFILHKRNYCRTKFINLSSCRDDVLKEKSNPAEPPEDKTVNNKLLLDNIHSDDQCSSKSLTPVIEKLKERQEIKQLTQELLVTDLSKSESKNQDESVILSDSDLLLEEIATNNAAVFQTVLKSMPQVDIRKPEFMRKEVMEIHGILDSDEAVIGSDGKICNFQTYKLRSNSMTYKTDFKCSECDMRFSTKKTLSFHLKSKHNNSKLVYVCPDCKETFANAWCVYRHLYKVHRKSTAQVKRLREQVHNSIIRKDEDTNKKSDKKDASDLEKTDEENQWLNNIEGDNDFQMCGGCGKRFERKAALHSHAALCIKRIAVCNTIKENNAKKKEEDSKTKIIKPEKPQSPEVMENLPKGAAKRKPYLLRTYKKDPEPICNFDEESVVVTTSKFPDNAPLDKVRKSSCKDDCAKNQQENIVGDVHTHSKKGLQQCENDNSDVVNDVCDSDSKINCDSTVLDMSIQEKTLKNEPHSDEFEIILSNTDIIPNDKVEIIKDEVSSPANQIKQEKTDNFELFCEKVAKSLQFIDKTFIKKDSDKEVPLIGEQSTKKDNSEDGSKFQSPGKISLRNLDELRGFPKETTVVIDEDMPILEASVSPKKTSPKRLVKRKRTSSLDLERTNKILKQSNFEILLEKPDLNFMSRAAPYMNRENLTCKSCQLKHTSLSKLLWHMSRHFSWFRFQCSRCSFVSFSKTECANHAKESHNIKGNEILSVVLPIPSWKTLLMSSEFKELKNEDELNGQLTNEVKPDCQNEFVSEDNNEISLSENPIDTLFIDSENVDLVTINDNQSLENEAAPIKNEIIDITNDDQENFQLEVPQEIYTLDVFEVINIDEQEDRRETIIKEEVNCNDFTETTPSDSKNTNSNSNDNKNVTNNSINVRPTRNRMRSIKTLQNDFFYDLGKIPKQSDTVAKTNVSQKQKKNQSSSTTSKKEKELRVYTKHK